VEDAGCARGTGRIVRGFRVESVRVVGRALRLGGSNWRMVGQDGGQSIALDRGSLFVFADTLIAPGDAPEMEIGPLLRQRRGIFLGNAAGIAPGGVGLREAMGRIEYVSDGQGIPRELLQTTPLERLAGYRLWPQHGIAMDGRVFLFYIAVLQVGDGGLWGFASQGTGLAVVDPAVGGCERLRWADEWRMWPALPATVHAGVQVLKAEEWIYVYASREEGLEFRAFVARVRPGEIEQPGGYEFYCGERGWSRNLLEGESLGPCGREFSVSWNEYLGGYLMTYLDAYTGALLMRAGEQPWGPFSEPVSLGMVPRDPRTELVSLGFEHPQYAGNGGGELFVSYSEPRFLQNTLLAVRLG